MLQELLNQLQKTWDFTSEELTDIRSSILEYAQACCIDSSVAEEMEQENLKDLNANEGCGRNCCCDK